MINHHEKDLMFKGNSALPLNAAALNSLFSPRFRHIDVASLVALLWTRFGSGSYSKVTASLVNVCSPFSGFSNGYVNPPPASAAPYGAHVLFTFSVKQSTGWDTKSILVNHISNRCSNWGSDTDSRRFITLAISSTEAAALGLIHLQRNEIFYLYRVLGIIFRSIFMHYTPEQIDDLKKGQRIVQFDSESRNVFFYKDKFLSIPLSAIVRFPYHTWQFNENIWQVAPNLIPHSTEIEPELALYYFLFLTSISADVPSSDPLRKLFDRISGVLTIGLMSFSQYLKNPSDYQFELSDLIAPNVLASLIYSGHSKVELNSRYYLDNLKENVVALADQLRGQFDEGVLDQALSPYNESARSLLIGSKTITNKLFNLQ